MRISIVRPALRHQGQPPPHCCQFHRRDHRTPSPHHINGEKDNNSHDNLIPLCSTCHGRVHSGSDELAWLSALWATPRGLQVAPEWDDIHSWVKERAEYYCPYPSCGRPADDTFTSFTVNDAPYYTCEGCKHLMKEYLVTGMYQSKISTFSIETGDISPAPQRIVR